MNKGCFLKKVAATLILGIMVSPVVTARASEAESSLAVSVSSYFSRAPRNAYGQKKNGTCRLKLSKPSSEKKATKKKSNSRKTKKKSPRGSKSGKKSKSTKKQSKN